MAAPSRTEEKNMPFEDKMRPVFMISVAAELAEMHPQTLRMYERRGLIRPRRSSKSTRLYSLADVERLRRIQQLVGGMRFEPRRRRTGPRDGRAARHACSAGWTSCRSRWIGWRPRPGSSWKPSTAATARSWCRSPARADHRRHRPAPRQTVSEDSSKRRAAARRGVLRPRPAHPPRAAGRHRAALRQPSKPPDRRHVQRLRQTPLPRLHGLFGGRHQVQGMRHAAPVGPGDPQDQKFLLAIAAGSGDGHRPGLRLLLTSWAASGSSSSSSSWLPASAIWWARSSAGPPAAITA